MNTILIIVMLTLTPSGNVIKNTTEVPTASFAACIAQMQVVMETPIDPKTNMTIASVACKTPTNDTSHLTFM